MISQEIIVSFIMEQKAKGHASRNSVNGTNEAWDEREPRPIGIANPEDVDRFVMEMKSR